MVSHGQFLGISTILDLAEVAKTVKKGRGITFADDVQIKYVAHANPKRKGSKS